MMMSKPNPQYQQQQQKIASSGDTTHKNFTFLPMLCSSSSSKQVKASHQRCASSSSTTSSTVSDDPSSPKVGCMGQVKKNNKVVGFPNIISFTSSTTSSSNSSNNSIISTHHHIIKCHEPNNYTSNNIIKYYKLKRFFSTKSPTSVIPVTKTATAGSRKGKIGRKNAGNVIVCKSKGNEEKSCNRKSDDSNNNEKGSLVNLVEMDPPLPVVKKVVQKEEGSNEGEKMSTLWKRRSGGAPLQSLRVQVIQPNIISPVTANTV